MARRRHTPEQIVHKLREADHHPRHNPMSPISSALRPDPQDRLPSAIRSYCHTSYGRLCSSEIVVAMCALDRGALQERSR